MMEELVDGIIIAAIKDRIRDITSRKREEMMKKRKNNNIRNDKSRFI